MVEKHPGLVEEELCKHSQPTPAMLTSLVAEWQAAADPVEDVDVFASAFAHQQLVLEVRLFRLREAPSWEGRAYMQGRAEHIPPERALLLLILRRLQGVTFVPIRPCSGTCTKINHNQSLPYLPHSVHPCRRCQAGERRWS